MTGQRNSKKDNCKFSLSSLVLAPLARNIIIFPRIYVDINRRHIFRRVICCKRFAQPWIAVRYRESDTLLKTATEANST